MMVSLRFPFSFSNRRNPISPLTASRPFYAATVCLATGALAGAVAASGLVSWTEKPRSPFFQNALDFISSSGGASPLWGSLSLAESSAEFVENKTGFSFPGVIENSRRLLGVGLRKKSLLGLKNIDVYAFGVYADNDGVKRLLSDKYGNLSASELKEKTNISDDLLEADIPVTVVLQIVYGRLSIRSVRGAFEESVGSRLLKFGGDGNKALLQRFTSQFKDEYKIPRGSMIQLSREEGYILRTIIDGTEVGSIKSKLLCRSILDLYIGNQPFDKQAREDIETNLLSVVKS